MADKVMVAMLFPINASTDRSSAATISPRISPITALIT